MDQSTSTPGPHGELTLKRRPRHPGRRGMEKPSTPKTHCCIRILLPAHSGRSLRFLLGSSWLLIGFLGYTCVVVRADGGVQLGSGLRVSVVFRVNNNQLTHHGLQPMVCPDSVELLTITLCCVRKV
eukprot:jgi/Botrbrau1/6508/Bobra.0034s0081.1